MPFTASGEMVFPILISSKSTKIEMLRKRMLFKTFCHFLKKRNQIFQFFLLTRETGVSLLYTNFVLLVYPHCLLVCCGRLWLYALHHFFYQAIKVNAILFRDVMSLSFSFQKFSFGKKLRNRHAVFPLNHIPIPYQNHYRVSRLSKSSFGTSTFSRKRGETLDFRLKAGRKSPKKR